jgi:DNA-directed RNA polymerase specialized sigma subunit
VMSTVYGLNTSKQVWSALSNRFASQSTAHIAHIKRQQQSLSQGSKTCTEYLQFAKSLADQLAAVGKTIDDDDLISYVIGGLNSSFNAFVTVVSFNTQIKPLTFDDFQNELLNHEMLINQQQSDASQHQSAATDISSFALVTQKTPQQSHPKNK